MKSHERTRELLMSLYEAMRTHFGHRNWWPGDTPFEVCVGAVLTQNTSWKNVAKAIDNLKGAQALDPLVMHRMSHEELAELIRPAGYYNIKARRLSNFINCLVERYEGNLQRLFAIPIEPLRDELLAINGVGPETADSMILYGAEKPIFVVDAYTKRVLSRHGIIDGKALYPEVQALFHDSIPRDTTLYNDFHAQFVAVGHHYCKKKPRCGDCPLAVFPLSNLECSNQ